MAVHAMFPEAGSWVAAAVAMARFAFVEFLKIMMIGAFLSGVAKRCSDA